MKKVEFISAAADLLAFKWKEGIAWMHSTQTAYDELLYRATQPEMYARLYKLRFWQWFDAPRSCIMFWLLRSKLIRSGELKIKERRKLDNYLATIEFSRNDPKNYADRQAIRQFILSEGYTSWQVFQAFCSKATDTKAKQDWPRIQPRLLQQITKSNLPLFCSLLVSLALLAAALFLKSLTVTCVTTFLLAYISIYLCVFQYRYGEQWEKGQTFIEQAQIKGITF
jgi:hypothetical protein